ncbi:GNAT family N-acetyltransferase [Myceligenerans xiligouense]|uniref:Acetyltransferase (GNAT) family protein n=1 Tax=Myceligenerans xiligouense TaxID=253184 RepID=A0A3N4YQC0_9MICO|nr:GNAT family N-acetyltransferase [Myceligenerans xiligouense]RPF21534.1 acetyltransferase (GNAT) family protein [Myceligenerans xiligouense]
MITNDRGSGSTIRPYQPNDRDAVTEICVRTAAGGKDARGIYSDDLLMPDVYCLPYVTYAPDLAWVVDDAAGRAIGYVLAVADTRAFVDWYAAEWAPGFRARHPRPGLMRRDYRYSEEALVRDGADAHRMVRGITPAELADYPAHLHIDLLPEGQRQGLGRRLLDTLRAALAERGVPGVHLGMDPDNTGAGAFYAAYGFHELPSHRPEAPLLGIGTR